MGATGLSPIPDHVPPELVIDFDYYYGPEVLGEPAIGLSKLHDGPDIFYTPRNEGHWMVTRAKDARDILLDNKRFSSAVHYNRRLDPMQPYLIPAQVDPPIQTAYRKILHPLMSPAAVLKLEGEIRELTREVIENVRAKGGCEFFSEVAQLFPTVIFLKWANLPVSDRAMLADIVDKTTHDPTPGGQVENFTRLSSYLESVLKERRARPGDDLISKLATAKIDGQTPPEQEVLFLLTNILLGGVDTVVAGLTSFLGYLGRNPEKYRQLVDDPGIIRQALEELMRAYGVANTERCLKYDTEFRGIKFKKYDRIVILPALLNVDPHEIDHPLTVDFNRPQSPHMFFGVGIHHCVGAHLARLEMRIFFEEWTKAIPKFSLRPGEVIEGVGGFVFRPPHVHLVWDRAETRSPYTGKP